MKLSEDKLERLVDYCRMPSVSAIVKEILALRAAKVVSDSVIDFYGDKKNWEHGISYSQNNLMIESDMTCHRGDYFYAGKSARNGKAKIAEIMKDDLMKIGEAIRSLDGVAARNKDEI